MSQDALLSFLQNIRSYPHRPKSVRLVQTHASFIFLAPPYVFKVKKPVNFGFLDFSTLEQRRHFCEREVTLNRRLAREVYLDVVPISWRQGRLTFGDGDRVVEYAVKMRLLSKANFLDQRLKRGHVTLSDLDRIVGVLKDFYLSQHPTEQVEEWGTIERLRISTDENFQQIESFTADSRSTQSASVGSSISNRVIQAPTLSRAAFETLRGYTTEFYQDHSALFRSRIREQRIRDCHGDLHLEHIHLTPRRLNIFDCIEFNDRFRYVDIANDAAFLAMDLDFEGRPDFARYFARRMAEELRDTGMTPLMDFYKCYRAIVRGKVESLHAIAPAAPEAERFTAADRARRYFRLALQYAVAGSQRLVLVVMGRIASGKSTLARALSAELGWPVYSSDVLRKQLAGLALDQRGTLATRNRLYSATMTQKTYRGLLAAADAELKRDSSVILDATFSRRAQRELLAQHFGRRGIAWCVVEARASDAEVRRRLGDRAAKPNEVSDARLEDFAKLTRHYEPPDELPCSQWVRVHTKGPIERHLTQTLQRLAKLQVHRTANLYRAAS